jgi:hypothetical protein
MRVHLPHDATANTAQSHLSSLLFPKQPTTTFLSLSFLQIKSSATYLFFSTEQEQPPTPSLNYVYCKNQQLDPNPFSKNIKSAGNTSS